jgi:sugar lactone lactonase YvrE
MSVFIERFVLATLAGAFLLIVVNNVFKLRYDQLGAITLMLVAAAYLAATLVQRAPTNDPQQPPPNSREEPRPPDEPDAKPTADTPRPESKPQSADKPKDSIKAEPPTEPPQRPPAIVPMQRREPSPVAGCPPWPTDTPPKVTLKPDELIVALDGAILHLDRSLKETTISTGGYLANARGVAVADGQILVTTQACSQGGVVSIDPLTGTQTPIALGFRTAMGIAVEASGKTIVVGDEDPKDGRWGQLVRVNLESREQAAIANLMAGNSARGIAIHPDTGEVYFADGTVNRVGQSGMTPQIEIDDLNQASAIAVAPDGTLLVGQQSGALLQVQRGTRRPLTVTRSIVGSLNGLAVSNDRRWLYVSGSGGMGSVVKIALPFSTPTEPIPVWQGRRSVGGVVTVAIVRNR